MSSTPPANGSTPDSAAADRAAASIKPVKKKIGEARDNLRRREAWYQRRTGGRPKRSAS